MITSIYRGGLGNQLFQIACGYFLAKNNNDNYKINPNLHVEYGQGNHIKNYLNTIFKNIEKTDYKGDNLYKESQFNFSNINYQNNLLLDGYFQSEKYFPNFKKQLNELFNFNHENIKNDICTIHIRTGDYIRQPSFNVITKKYFDNSIKFIVNICPQVKFKIITDDINYAKNYIPNYLNFEFSTTSELNDLKLLSSSDFCIISNSSFSWWGSYLGKDKITVCPCKWFNVSYDTSDVYRNDMIKMEL